MSQNTGRADYVSDNASSSVAMEYNPCVRMCYCLIQGLVGICFLPFILVFLALYFVGIGIWIAFTCSCIGPVWQYFINKKDDTLLDRNDMLKKNSDLYFQTIPGDIHSCTNGASYQVMVRLTTPRENYTGRRHPIPVCIPNGLGATLVSISILHERLVEEGFTVLSYDRLGVGWTDDNPTAKPPTARDVVQEMHCVMQHAHDTTISANARSASAKQSSQPQWILIGPSMGSTVAQAYIASEYGDEVVGFLNMDGLPYPFIKVKSAFVKAASIYTLYTRIIWTGMLRPFIGLMLRTEKMRWLSSKAFPIEVSIAQMNQTRFYGNLACEMITMMNCCEYVDEAWGEQSVLRLSAASASASASAGGDDGNGVKLLDALIRARPQESVVIDCMTAGLEERSVTTERSKSEVGTEWSSASDVQRAVRALLLGKGLAEGMVAQAGAVAGAGVADIKPSHNPLSENLLEGSGKNNANPTMQLSHMTQRWNSLSVRVMSARNHSFGNPIVDSFYTQEMRNLAAAEHAVHALLCHGSDFISKNNTVNTGTSDADLASRFRIVYPRLNHMQMFAQTSEIIKFTVEIAQEQAARAV